MNIATPLKYETKPARNQVWHLNQSKHVLMQLTPEYGFNGSQLPSARPLVQEKASTLSMIPPSARRPVKQFPHEQLGNIVAASCGAVAIV